MVELHIDAHLATDLARSDITRQLILHARSFTYDEEQKEEEVCPLPCLVCLRVCVT